ncbi:hypothetical protein CHH27_11940 [Labrenzia sp. VG12]|nr:hypothetical protein CHH27_11940 [Labrenzia sp. VG12]
MLLAQKLIEHDDNARRIGLKRFLRRKAFFYSFHGLSINLPKHVRGYDFFVLQIWEEKSEIAKRKVIVDAFNVAWFNFDVVFDCAL